MDKIVFRYSVSVVQWALNVPYNIKVYLFGSRIDGVPKSCSDLDIALEFKDDEDIKIKDALWYRFHSYWEKQLSKILTCKPHLCLYEGNQNCIRLKIDDFLTTKGYYLIFDSEYDLSEKASEAES